MTMLPPEKQDGLSIKLLTIPVTLYIQGALSHLPNVSSPTSQPVTLRSQIPLVSPNTS